MAQNQAAHPSDRLEGQAPAIEALRAQIRRLAAFDAPGGPMVPTLLLQGETGTGKGLVARVAHDSGPRARGPFVPVNCAAIPETLLEAELFGHEAGAFTDAKRSKAGLFEAAAQGTLLLDEIDSLPLALQAKLLTAIESKQIRRLGATAEHPVDVKLIAATQHDLGRLAAAGRFRPDLYHRLAVVVLTLPPLRERGDDVVHLGRALLARFAAGYAIPPKRLTRDAEGWLRRQPWPGNVRELGHLMERVTLLSPEPTVDAADLERLAAPSSALGPEPTREPAPAPEPAEAGAADPELERLREALARTGGNVVKAARLLGVSRDAVRYRMRRYGIERPTLEATPGFAPPRTAPPREEEAAEPATEGQAAGSEEPSPEAPMETAPAWEQKPVAVVAVELTWPEPAGPGPRGLEPWTEAARWERLIQEKLGGLGGVLLQRSPSLVVWAFGVPRALDQLAQRAVHGALAVRQLVAGLTRREHVPEMRIGVHAGGMLVDTSAGPSPVRALPVGETMSVPVRLTGQAVAGEVLASAEVARQVEAWVVLQPVEVPSRSAPARPLAAYRVVGVSPSRERGVRPGGRPMTRFVGRERELATLRELFAAACAGSGQAVGIAGEPGVGKSRLLYEFQRSLAGREVLYGEGHCLAHGSVTPYLPLVELAKTFFDVADSDPDDAVRDRIFARLRALGLEADLHAPYLLRLLGRAAEELARLGQETVKARTLDAIRQVTLGASRQAPLVFAVENVHWIDPTSEQCLAALADHLPGARCLLVTTYRPGYRPPWLDRSFTTQIALRPLATPESREIIRAVAAQRPLPDPVEAHVLAKAEGNPFFLEELTRAVGDHEGASSDFPDNIRGVILARIDRLSDGARRVLQAASVLGREFPVWLLGAILDRSEGLVTELEELARLEFLYPRPAEEPLYVFKHALTQEAAYQSLAPPRRSALHAAAGRALEAAYAARLDEGAEGLAHHFSRAGDRAKAVEYLSRAAEKAARAYAHAEALALLAEALDHAAELPEAARPGVLPRLVLRRAQSLYFVGRFQDSVESLEARAALLDAAGDPTLGGHWHFWLCHMYSRLGRHAEAEASARRAIAEAERSGDAATAGKARGLMAFEAHWLGRPLDGIAEARQAIALLEPTPERWWEAMAHFYLAFNLFEASRFPEALEAAARCRAIGEAIGDPFLVSYGLFTAGWIHAVTGEWAAAVEACREAVRRSADPVSGAYSSAFLGYALVESGQTGEGRPLLEQAVQRMREFRFPQAEALYGSQLARAHLAAGDVETAERVAQAALATAEGSYRRAVGLSQRVLGEIARVRGALAAAEGWLRQARETFTAIGEPFEIARTDVALGALADAVGDAALAARCREAAAEAFRSLGLEPVSHRRRLEP